MWNQQPLRFTYYTQGRTSRTTPLMLLLPEEQKTANFHTLPHPPLYPPALIAALAPYSLLYGNWIERSQSHSLPRTQIHSDDNMGAVQYVCGRTHYFPGDARPYPDQRRWFSARIHVCVYVKIVVRQTTAVVVGELSGGSSGSTRGRRPGCWMDITRRGVATRRWM